MIKSVSICGNYLSSSTAFYDFEVMHEITNIKANVHEHVSYKQIGIPIHVRTHLVLIKKTYLKEWKDLPPIILSKKMQTIFFNITTDKCTIMTLHSAQFMHLLMHVLSCQKMLFCTFKHAPSLILSFTLYFSLLISNGRLLIHTLIRLHVPG